MACYCLLCKFFFYFWIWPIDLIPSENLQSKYFTRSYLAQLLSLGWPGTDKIWQNYVILGFRIIGIWEPTVFSSRWVAPPHIDPVRVLLDSQLLLNEKLAVLGDPLGIFRLYTSWPHSSLGSSACNCSYGQLLHGLLKPPVYGAALEEHPEGSARAKSSGVGTYIRACYTFALQVALITSMLPRCW